MSAKKKRVKTGFPMVHSLTKSEEQLKAHKERERKIDNTIDLVVHDLVSKGHFPPGKSYLLKTNKELKEHIGRMRDRLAKREEAEEKARTRSYGIFRQSGANKALTVSNKNSLIRRENPQPSYSTLQVIVPAKTSNQPENVQNKSRNVSLEAPPSRSDSVYSQTITESQVFFKPPETPQSPKDIGKYSSVDAADLKKLDAVAPPTGLNPVPRTNIPPDHFIVSMDFAGFTNDEIILDLKGRRLTITAQERRKEALNSKRKLTEILEIPSHVDMENVRIGRQPDGMLVIEEYVDKKHTK